ncbi:hypothetical protein ACJMK2_038274 [Sinanodonta woodiana]|uniref:FAD-dependent oxidoreductase domain-containing protein 1 n=1 Tax=Sinanodonta woodiana TaxID=1069815 RepID=A0ABD3WBS3_SINWO
MLRTSYHLFRCFNKRGLLWKQSPRYLTEDEKRDLPAIGRYRSPWKMFKKEMKDYVEGNITPVEPEIPLETDALIIGGGAIGSSVAFWLKQRNPKGFTVTVIERDPGYTQASSMLAVGGIRHQFSVPENVQMSMFTSEFFRNIKEYLSVLDSDPPDVQFNHQGYLFLVPEERAEYLAKSVEMQNNLGAKIRLMNPEKLAQKFPWLNLDGIALASYGMEGEGWFDPWLLVRALKAKNISLGVQYVKAEVVDFDMKEMGLPGKKEWVLNSTVLKSPEGKLFKCRMSYVVNCAGPWAGQIAQMAGIGIRKEEGLSIPLPVEPRKRFVYVVHCPDGPGIEAPLTIDTTGVYFRREGLGGYYLCGASPSSEEEEPDTSNLDVDFSFYENHVWPALSYRVPKFEVSKLKSAWAGFYDYNTVDQNLIIGHHPYHTNMLFANGLSGHGIQHAIPIGRALMELLIDGEYKTIDLSRFEFQRFIDNEPIQEMAIV